MLIYKKGDILKANENIICHQVNENGVDVSVYEYNK